VALCSLIFDTAVTLQVLFASRSLQWEEVEFEWESADKGRLESIKLIWYLLLAYFGSAAIVCGYGLIGVLKVRFCILCFALVLILVPRATLRWSGYTETAQ